MIPKRNERFNAQDGKHKPLKYIKHKKNYLKSTSVKGTMNKWKIHETENKNKLLSQLIQNIKVKEETGKPVSIDG